MLGGPRRLILALIVFGSAWGATAPARADYWEIRKAGRIRVLVLEGAPLLFGWKAGQAPGFEREVLQNFGRLEHLDLELRSFTSATRLLEELEKGNGDLAAGGLSAQPGGVVDFSAEVLPSRNVVVTWKRATPITRIEELAEEKVGTVRGTALAAAVAAAGVPAAHIDDSILPGGLLPALRSGRVSACVVAVEEVFPAKQLDTELQIGPYVGPKHSVAFMMRKDEPKLRAALDEYLGNLRHSPTWNRLLLKYFGDSTLDILNASR